MNNVQMKENRKAKSYITDHLGSVLNTEASAGRKMFSAFGDQLSGRNERGEAFELEKNSSPVVYGFAGREYDIESGLYYNRARMYNCCARVLLTSLRAPTATLNTVMVFNSEMGSIAGPAWLLGGGGAVGVVVVGKGSAGGFRGTNFSGNSDYGTFSSEGIGMGVTAGVGAYGGYISDRNINTVNVNFGVGLVGASIYLNPDNFSIEGGSIGPARGLGGSITTTRSTFSCGK